MTVNPCATCATPCTSYDNLGKPICPRCQYQKTIEAIANPGGSKVVVTPEMKECRSCRFKREVPVTRVDGGPPDFDEQCEMCQAMDSAKAHEKRARELRRRAAAILKTRRAMRTKRGSRS